MVNPNYSIRNQVIDLTTNKIMPVVDNLYKESLRAMLHLFGNIYYIDGNANRVKVRCTHGNPERMASRLVADNTMELPLISISEVSTSNSDERRRHSHVLISEKSWDPKTRRATRLVSLAPRPINITYEINVWTKYKSDMDMVRATIFTMFNPDVEVRTKFSDYNRAFLVEERDLGSLTANDTEDRVIQKAITISLETYITSPKFRVTSTGQIDANIFEVTVGNSINDTDKVIEFPVDDSTSVNETPPIPEAVIRLNLTTSVDLTVAGSFDAGSTQANLGVVSVDTSALPMGVNEIVNLGTANLSLSNAITTIATSNFIFDSDPLALTLTVDESFTAANNKVEDLDNLEVSTTVNAISLEDGVNLSNIEVSTTLQAVTFNEDLNLLAVSSNFTLPTPSFTNTTGGDTQLNLGVVTTTFTIPAHSLETTTNLSSVDLSTSVLHSIDATMSVADVVLATSLIGAVLDSELNITIPLGASSSPDF